MGQLECMRGRGLCVRTPVSACVGLQEMAQACLLHRPLPELRVQFPEIDAGHLGCYLYFPYFYITFSLIHQCHTARTIETIMPNFKTVVKF